MTTPEPIRPHHPPEQVLVNVADLRNLWRLFEDIYEATAPKRLILAIPGASKSESEWEPTDDMRAKGRRALGGGFSDEGVDEILQALHREGLL